MHTWHVNRTCHIKSRLWKDGFGDTSEYKCSSRQPKVDVEDGTNLRLSLRAHVSVITGPAVLFGWVVDLPEDISAFDLVVVLMFWLIRLWTRERFAPLTPSQQVYVFCSLCQFPGPAFATCVPVTVRFGLSWILYIFCIFWIVACVLLLTDLYLLCRLCILGIFHLYLFWVTWTCVIFSCTLDFVSVSWMEQPGYARQISVFDWQ